MASKKDILALNDYLSITEKQGRIGKRGKRGKSKVTMRIEAEPILFDLSNQTLMRDIATRYERAVRSKLQEGGEQVIDATDRARGVSEKAWYSSTSGQKQWVKRRFGPALRLPGGVRKETPPITGNRRAFRHSGRLEQSIRARWVPKAKQWIINVAGNRLRRETFGSEAEFRNMLAKLLRTVPAMETGRFVKSSEFHRGIDAWIEHGISVVKRNQQLKAARRKAILSAAKAAKGFIL